MTPRFGPQAPEGSHHPLPVFDARLLSPAIHAAFGEYRLWRDGSYADEDDTGFTSRLTGGGRLCKTPAANLPDVLAKLAAYATDSFPPFLATTPETAFETGEFPNELAGQLFASALSDLERLAAAPDTSVWDAAIKRLDELQAVVDAPDEDDAIDAAVDAYYEAMDEMFVGVAAPSGDALATKFEMAAARQIEMPSEWIEAFAADARRLGAGHSARPSELRSKMIEHGELFTLANEGATSDEQADEIVGRLVALEQALFHTASATRDDVIARLVMVAQFVAGGEEPPLESVIAIVDEASTYFGLGCVGPVRRALARQKAAGAAA